MFNFNESISLIIHLFCRSNALTLTFIIWSSLIAIIFPDVTKVISILGGLCSVTICYVIPSKLITNQQRALKEVMIIQNQTNLYHVIIIAICKLKLSNYHWYSCENLPHVIFFGILSCVGYIAVAVTVY